MSRRLVFQTRALGAEPGDVDKKALADWIADHRGTAADIISYNLDQSLIPQLTSGITSPCAGGLFMKERILASLICVAGLAIETEMDINPESMVKDLSLIRQRRKDAWFSLPSPNSLGLVDEYYHDDDECTDALASVYRTLMRSMRDAGIGGHILISKKANNLEISSLVRKNVLFFLTEPDVQDLETLLEHQARIAVGAVNLGMVFGLAEEFTLDQLIIIDADKEAITFTLEYVDPDQIVIGGYCTESCDEYWTGLVKSASYS